VCVCVCVCVLNECVRVLLWLFSCCDFGGFFCLMLLCYVVVAAVGVPPVDLALSCRYLMRMSRFN
jgi:hypothetical protein